MKTTSTVLLRSTLAVALSSVSAMAIAQEADPFFLGTLVLRGDKISRTADEVAPSISILTQQDIEGPATTSISSVLQGLPNVIADEDATIPAIRGISSTVNTNQVFGSGVLPRVPVLVDNVATPVAQSSSYMSNTAWDVSTVEVARGPQPTSTGRNAFSGAIRVYTNDPVFEPEAALRFGASDLRNGKNAAFMLNQPFFDDQVAVRVAGDIRTGDTLVKVQDPRITTLDPNDLEYKSLRTKVRYQPAEIPGLDLKFTYDYQDTKDHYAPVIQAGNEPDEFFINEFLSNSGYEETEKKRYIFDGSYELSDSSTLFFRASKSESELGNPYLGASLDQAGFRDFGVLAFSNEETEYEAYLQFGDLGPLTNGVVGIIHNSSSEVVDNELAGDLTDIFLIDVDGDYKNTAFYAELEWDLAELLGVDGLTLITGGRYEKDERTRKVFTDTNLQASRTFKEDVFLPKFGLRYEPQDNLEFGYTYTEGFRPGGLEVDLVSGFIFPIGAPGLLPLSPFDKETIKNHEIYAKGSFLDDRLKVGATLFYYKYEDAQVAGASEVASLFPGFLLTGNIPEATGKGVELSADYRGDNGLGLSASAGWLKTEITDAGNPGTVAATFEGSELPNSPDFTGSIGVSYAHSSGWDARADLRHVGKMTNGLGLEPVNSYTVVDVAAGYDFTAFNNTDMRLDLTVNNLTDKAYVLENADGRNVVGRPREVAFSVTARF